MLPRWTGPSTSRVRTDPARRPIGRLHSTGDGGVGAYRLLLAVIVMMGHLLFYPYALPYPLPGEIAVEAFYVVSGFLITLVLTEKYDGRLLLFYSNRFLRLFPIYWAVLAVYVLANVAVARGWVSTVMFPDGNGNPSIVSALVWSQNHPTTWTERLLLGFMNLFIVGQDLTRSLGEPQSNLYYHMFIYVRVAWTVGVEIAFYALAPFVVRRISHTAIVLVLSLCAQMIIMRKAVNPYDYQLFIFEAWLFMAGALAYHAYAWLRTQDALLVRRYALAAVVALLVMTLAFSALHIPRLLYLLAAAACLPGAVLFGRQFPLDNVLGEFSYPVYLIHPLLQIVTLPGPWAQPVAFLIVALLSWLVVRYVERPIERFRQRRVRRSIERPAGGSVAPDLISPQTVPGSSSFRD